MTKKKKEQEFANFNIAQNFDIEWDYTSKAFYKIIHEIYKTYPSEPIIEVSKLPHILNPRFWDVVNGVNREKIMRLKYQNKPISKEYFLSLKLRKERLSRTRIVLVNVREMVRTWDKIIEYQNEDKESKLREILRRIKAFKTIIEKINQNELKNTLILADESENVNIIYPSLTISKHFMLQTVRYENDGNFKKFSFRPYCSISERWFNATWSEIYHKGNSKIPNIIHIPLDIPKHNNLVKKCSLKSINLLIRYCDKLKNEIVDSQNDLKKVVQEYEEVDKVYEKVKETNSASDDFDFVKRNSTEL